MGHLQVPIVSIKVLILLTLSLMTCVWYRVVQGRGSGMGSGMGTLGME